MVGRKLHDIFDEVHAGDRSIEPSFTLMSTWHSDESLEEALAFFIHRSSPLDTEIDTTSYIAVSVERVDWAKKTERILMDLASSGVPRVTDEPK